MRLLFVADGRSPIALNWMRFFVENGDEVFLASTFKCDPGLDLMGLDFVHVAFSGMKGASPTSSSARSASRTLNLRTSIRHYLGPLTITHAASRLRRVIERVQPDLIHAMRIPYEGMLAADSYTGVPLLVSVWGNDFTLHAPSSPLMRHYTRWTMKVAHALHSDCRRDVRLALEWGYSPNRPNLIVPGNGGIRTEVFYPSPQLVDDPVVLNPRGFRAYVRNDVFFKSIPLVLKEIPGARFQCAAMQEESQALKWISDLGIANAVELLPSLPHAKMGEVYRRAAVLVSPSVHDGTPNSLLEGMACGCYPVAGNLESIREWIKDGENGTLTDPTDPEVLANSIIEAIMDKDLRKKAAGLNAKHIMERAEYFTCMAQAKTFYEHVLSSRT
jgi:glycosyltransferase involved in cell wall biosynthesis